jgi:hypothetical protein
MPAAPVLAQPWPMSRPTDLSGAVRFLRFALWASAAFGLLFVAIGLFVTAEDASSHADEMDGLGVFVGELMTAAGLLWSGPPAGLAVGLARAARRGRSPKPVGVASAVLGGLQLALGIYCAASGAAQVGTMLPEISASLLVLVAGLGVLADDEVRQGDQNRSQPDVGAR